MRKPLQSCKLSQNDNIKMHSTRVGCETVVMTQGAANARPYEHKNLGSIKTKIVRSVAINTKF